MGRVHGEDELEVSAGFLVHSKHHLGHREIVTDFKILGELSCERFEGGERSVEIAFKALNESDLVARVLVPRV